MEWPGGGRKPPYVSDRRIRFRAQTRPNQTAPPATSFGVGVHFSWAYGSHIVTGTNLDSGRLCLKAQKCRGHFAVLSRFGPLQCSQFRLPPSDISSDSTSCTSYPTHTNRGGFCRHSWVSLPRPRGCYAERKLPGVTIYVINGEVGPWELNTEITVIT